MAIDPSERLAVRMMTIGEFANAFRVSRRTMEGLLQKHPVGFKVGNRWRFDASDVTRLREALECSSSPAVTARHSGMSGGLSPAAAMAKARQLLAVRLKARR